MVEKTALSVNLEGTVGVIHAATRRSNRNAVRDAVWAVSADVTRAVVCTVTRRVALLATHETTDAVTYGRTMPVTDKTEPRAADGIMTATTARRDLPSKDIGRCAWQRPSETGRAD